MGKFAIGFEHFLIAENQLGTEALLKIRNIVSTMFLSESNYDSETLRAELRNLFRSEADRQAANLFFNWLKQKNAYGRIDPDDYQSWEYIYRNEEEVDTMFVTSIEQERQRFFQNGLLEGKIETAKEMLAEGMEAEFISRMTKLPESQILELRDELASMKK